MENKKETWNKLYSKTDTMDEFIETDLKEAWNSKKIFNARVGSRGSSIEVKFALNDKVGQKLHGYRITNKIVGVNE